LRESVAPKSIQGLRKVDQSIFVESKQVEEDGKLTEEALYLAAQIEKKRLAEDKRYMGNESMKSKDYNDAIEHYTKSLELFPDEAATYSNRAMAYLQKK